MALGTIPNTGYGYPGADNLVQGTYAQRIALALTAWSEFAAQAEYADDPIGGLITRKISKNGAPTFNHQYYGKITGNYHQADGAQIQSMNMPGSIKSFKVDMPYVYGFLGDRYWDLINGMHLWNAASVSMGKDLAEQKAVQAFRTLFLGAAAANPISGLPGGITTSAANMNTDVNVFLDSVLLTKKTFLDNKIPASTKFYCWIRPAMRKLLLSAPQMYSRDAGGSGSVNSGQLPTWDGVEFITTPLLPSDNYAGLTGENNTYISDCTKLDALMGTSESLIRGQWAGLQLTMDDLPTHRATLLSGASIHAHGAFRVDHCARLVHP